MNLIYYNQQMKEGTYYVQIKKKLSDLTTKVNLVRNLSTTKELPVSTGAKLLGINRISVYYGGILVSEKELECKAIIDHLHTDNPTWGA